jgi:outer membrane protein
MMTRQQTRIVPVAVVLCTLLAGCVQPGDIEPTDVNRYQAMLLGQAQQEREAEGLDILRNTECCDMGKLDLQTDEKTGRSSVRLDLKEVVLRALANNLDIRVVSFDPGITRQQMMEAASEFDVVVFSNTANDGSTGVSVSDRQQNSTTNEVLRVKTTSGELGVRKKLTTGALVALTYQLTRSDTNSPFVRHRVAYEADIVANFTQPLLRNGWRDVSLAALRVARLNRKTSEAAFRQKVEDTVSEVVSTYWSLVQARRELVIQRELLEKTIETQQRVQARAELDATAVQVKQTEAAVETRRAALYRARKTIRDVQERLARLLADKQLSLLEDYDIIPMTAAEATDIRIDVGDQLATALERNPTVEQARVAVEAAGINVKVAQSAKLPRLDIVASAGLQSLDDAGRTFPKGKYQNYGVGLVFEYPIGNRGPEAVLARRRLEKLQAMANLKNLAHQVSENVKERVREIGTTYQELQAQQAAVEAAQLQLQALDDTEKIRGRLSPEFLQLKLSAQETLAAAQRSELQALVGYNSALVTLSRATGTVLDTYGVELSRLANLDDQQDR